MKLSLSSSLLTSIERFFVLLLSLTSLVSCRYAWQDEEPTGELTGKTRVFYVGAVERDWDYAPGGMNKVKGIKLAQDR